MTGRGYNPHRQAAARTEKLFARLASLRENGWMSSVVAANLPDASEAHSLTERQRPNRQRFLPGQTRHLPVIARSVRVREVVADDVERALADLQRRNSGGKTAH